MAMQRGQWQKIFRSQKNICGSKISTPRSRSAFGESIPACGDGTRSFGVGSCLFCGSCSFFSKMWLSIFLKGSIPEERKN